MSNQEVKPEPSEWDTLSPSDLEKEIATHRAMKCQFYNDCLDVAIAKRWTGFSCFWCPLRLSREGGENGNA